MGAKSQHSQLFMFYGRIEHVGETLTELQILGCELHKNAFGGRAPQEPAGRAIALPQTLAVIKGKGGKEREEKGWE